MKIVLSIATSLLFAASTALLAQEPSTAKEPPPEPPLLGTAPAECQWTVTYTPKTPEKDATGPQEVAARNMRRFYNPIVLSKRVLKGGGQMVVYTNYEAGIKSEAWVVNGFLYELPYRAGQSMNFETRKGSDFSEINWVKADNFRGTVNMKGVRVHLYESAGADSAASAKGTARRAYIDVTSRLPVMVDLGDTVLTYQYSGPAATFPTPDDRIKKLMRDSGVSAKH